MLSITKLKLSHLLLGCDLLPFDLMLLRKLNLLMLDLKLLVLDPKLLLLDWSWISSCYRAVLARSQAAAGSVSQHCCSSSRSSCVAGAETAGS